VNQRFLILGAFTLLALVLVFEPLKDLMKSATRSEYYSHIVLIPLVSVYLIYQKRRSIFSKPEPIYPYGLTLSACGVALYVFGYSQTVKLNPNDYASLLTFSAIVLWVGGFVCLYGIRGFQKASFPILFLIFMVPVPSLVIDKIIYVLQVGSTEATAILFGLIGVPVARESFVFQLPGISVEVAKQCSGIRSSLALFITSILAAHFFLQTGWKKAVLILSIFPITVLKNGIRIVALSMLAIHVDERILTQGFLHQSGGFIFYIPALGLLGLILWWLKSTEKSEVFDEKLKKNSV
jgi:exosortase